VKKAFSIGNSIGYGRPATRFKGNIFQAGSSKMGLFLCPARKIFLIIYNNAALRSTVFIHPVKKTAFDAVHQIVAGQSG
jgi:hypothetical protein